jgi:hypothetical protein
VIVATTQVLTWLGASGFQIRKTIKAIAQLALPMFMKSCNKFLGESWRAPDGTLGGAAFLVAGITTLGGCGALWDSGLTWI